jgi:predicted phosphodiesterase
MSFSFDLISDLHVDTWGAFDWEGMATSQFCVVAGDVSKNHDILVDALTKLGRCYQAVFYVDGNNEHVHCMQNLSLSYQLLVRRLAKIPNLVYLQDNVVVVDGVAILGTNGWWGYDFDLGIDPTQSAEWYQEKMGWDMTIVKSISKMASQDATYLTSSIKRLQTHNDVKKIVIVTHTVPDPVLINHDIDLDGRLKMNTMGNRYMTQALGVDTENKVHTWCFGHYHGSVDQVRGNVRFVNNCRGEANSKYSNWAYYPKRITIS